MELTTKEKIYDALSELHYPVAYGDSDITNLPRINFTLIHTIATRLSDKRHNKRPIYQVDFFSDRAIDIESEQLEEILIVLEEQGLHVAEFREVITPYEDEDRTYYHYFTEVF